MQKRSCAPLKKRYHTTTLQIQDTVYLDFGYESLSTTKIMIYEIESLTMIMTKYDILSLVVVMVLLAPVRQT